jgi:hypothetical protein
MVRRHNNRLSEGAHQRSVHVPTSVGISLGMAKMKATKALIVASALLVFSAGAVGQDARPYKEGPVTEVSYIRTKPGRFNDYIKYLGGSYKAQQDAMQKAGLIVGYRVFTVSPRTPQEADVILTVTYPNYAALDRSEEFDAISNKLVGPLAKQDKEYTDRGPMREFLGSTLMRELILK